MGSEEGEAKGDFSFAAGDFLELYGEGAGEFSALLSTITLRLLGVAAVKVEDWY